MKLELKNVSKLYGRKKALNDVSCVMEKGVYALLGPNGSGKTTLISIITGTLSPTGGNVRCDGRRAAGREFLSRLGYLPQYPKFYRDFRAIEFLKYMCALKGIPKKDVNERCERMLRLVNLSDEGNKKIGAYSGGMRQRLGIAQAMLNDPELLILDEPTSGLDPKERIRFRNIISSLSADRTVLLSTHIVTDAESIADRILLLKAGVLCEDETPSELCRRMEGKVWSVNVPAEESEIYLDKYLTGNLRHDGGMCCLRVISDEPVPGGAPITPCLDDVFLYTFKEESL